MAHQNQKRRVNTLPVPKSGQVRFEDVLAPLQGGPAKIEVPTAGENRFQKGLTALKGPGGISPEIQSVLDIIAAQTKEKETQVGAGQQALARRRGIQGSTIEGANVAAAVGEQTRVGRDISTNVLLESARSRIEGRRLAGQAQITRAGEEFGAEVAGNLLFAELDQQSKIAAANLTSDELASIRNLQEAGKDRELQLFLGNRGISIQQDNITAARDASRSQQKTQLIAGAATLAVLPF